MSNGPAGRENNQGPAGKGPRPQGGKGKKGKNPPIKQGNYKKPQALSGQKWEKAMQQKYNFMKSIVENDDITDDETFSAYMQDKIDNFHQKMPFKSVFLKLRKKINQLSEEDKQALMKVSRKSKNMQ